MPDRIVLSEHHFRIVWIAGRPYLMGPLRFRRRMIRKGGREYPWYYITVPRAVAEILAGDYRRRYNAEPEDIAVTIAITVAPWYHAVDLSGLNLEGLSEKALREIEALTLDKPPAERPELVAILATREEIEALGLDPASPITLKDIAKKLEEHRIPATSKG